MAGNKIFGGKDMTKIKKAGKLVVLALMLMAVSMTLIACGGGSSAVGDNPQAANTIIASSVKVEKTGDTATISYQTSAPVKSSSVVTSDFSFNEAPLWSEFAKASSQDGVNHKATVKLSGKPMSFMIYNSPNDKYNNGGKGIKIE